MADEKTTRKIDKQLKDLTADVDDIYSSIYLTRTDDKNNLDKVTGGINDSINDILAKINGQNISDISNLYVRLVDKENSGLKEEK